MSDRLTLELVVDDKGTATIKKFSQDGKKSFNEVETAAESLSRGITGVKNVWSNFAVGVGASIYVFKELYNAMNSLTQAYFEQEKADLKVAMALKNQGIYSRDALNSVREFSEQMMHLTATADEVSTALQGNFINYGMSVKQAQVATKAALDFAAAKEHEGMTVETASELIGKAFLGMTERLKRYGLSVDETLPKQEKYNQLLAQLGIFTGNAQARMGTYAGQWKYFSLILDDVKKIIGIAFIKSLEAVGVGLAWVGGVFYENLGKMVGGLEFIIGLLGKLPDFLKPLGGIGFNELNDSLKKTRIFLEDSAKAGYGTSNSLLTMLKSFDLVEQTVEKINTGPKITIIDPAELKKQEELEVNFLKQNYENIQKFLNEQTEISREAGLKQQAQTEAKNKAIYAGEWKMLEDIGAAQELFFADSKDRVDEDAEFWKMVFTQVEKHEEATLQQMGDAWELFGAESEKVTEARRKKQEEEALKVWEIERKLLGDIKQFTEEEYEFKKLGLDLQLAHYDKIGIDKVIREKWYQTELIKLEEERVKRSNDFFAGIAIAYEQNLRNQYTWGQQGIQLWNDIFGKGGALEKSFATLFNDFFTGQLKTFDDYWKAFCNSILKAFADMLAKMAAQWVAAQIGSLFGLGTGAGTGLTSGIVSSAIANTIGGTTAAGAAGTGAGSALVGGSAATAGAISGVATTGVTAGTAATVGTAGVATGTGTAGVTAGTGGALVSAAEFGAWALPAAIIAYGLMDRGTGQYLNPFNANAMTQSDLLGYILNPSGMIDLTRPELSTLRQMASDDPFFNPDNLWQYYISKTGLTPTADSIYNQGRELAWLMGDPTVQANAQKYLEELARHVAFSAGTGDAGALLNVDYFARGGIINEPIIGKGRSGRGYVLGEAGPEMITPMNGNNPAPIEIIFNINGNLIGDQKTFDDFVDQIRSRLASLNRWGYA